jgi:DNA-binding IclR family transcriptional regulator
LQQIGATVPETNQSVDRATQILKVLAAGGGRMTLTEIAEQVGVGNSTAHRILSSLCGGGLAQLDAKTRRYALGYGLLEMTADWLNRIEVRTAAMPSLQGLRQSTEETVALNLRDADRWVPVERLDTSREIRYVVELGRSRPLHVGAGGKAILAFLPKAAVDRQLQASGLSPAKRRRCSAATASSPRSACFVWHRP